MPILRYAVTQCVQQLTRRDVALWKVVGGSMTLADRWRALRSSDRGVGPFLDGAGRRNNRKFFAVYHILSTGIDENAV